MQHPTFNLLPADCRDERRASEIDRLADYWLSVGYPNQAERLAHAAADMRQGVSQ